MNAKEALQLTIQQWEKMVELATNHKFYHVSDLKLAAYNELIGVLPKDMVHCCVLCTYDYETSKVPYKSCTNCPVWPSTVEDGYNWTKGMPYGCEEDPESPYAELLMSNMMDPGVINPSDVQKVVDFFKTKLEQM